MHSSISKFEAERAELDAILNSGMLGRANNLVRLLTFVCEKHFEGATAEIKEYNIAVQALGRPHDFDPQMDTIVRVTAHALTVPLVTDSSGKKFGKSTGGGSVWPSTPFGSAYRQVDMCPSSPIRATQNQNTHT